MATELIWWGCFVLEVNLLVRGFAQKFVSKYPFFYSYVLFVLLQSILRSAVDHFRPEFYASTYWITQFLGLVIGCGVVFEIYRVGLKAYPGVARVARNLLFFLFAMTFAKALFGATKGDLLWVARTLVDLERNLRILQAFAMIALVDLLVVYAVPVGRNLKGIFIGYGLFIASSVVQLTLVSHLGDTFSRVWLYLQPACYLLSLVVWAAALWAYRPVPRPQPLSRFENGYALIATDTRHRLRRVDLHLRKTVR